MLVQILSLILISLCPHYDSDLVSLYLTLVLLGCTEVSLMLYWSIPYGVLSFPFLVWVRMTFACIIPAMFLSEFKLAPNIVITSLFLHQHVRHLQPNSDHLRHSLSLTPWGKLGTQMFRKGTTHKLKPSPSNITTIRLSNSNISLQYLSP